MRDHGWRWDADHQPARVGGTTWVEPFFFWSESAANFSIPKSGNVLAELEGTACLKCFECLLKEKKGGGEDETTQSCRTN